MCFVPDPIFNCGDHHGRRVYPRYCGEERLIDLRFPSNILTSSHQNHLWMVVLCVQNDCRRHYAHRLDSDCRLLSRWCMMTLPMTIFVFTLLRFIDRFPDRQANLTILDRKHCSPSPVRQHAAHHEYLCSHKHQRPR